MKTTYIRHFFVAIVLAIQGLTSFAEMVNALCVNG